VKIIGPLGRNIGFVNVRPLPSGAVHDRLRAELAALPELAEVHVVDGPITLVAKANSSILNDAHARYWIEHGGLAPDFPAPIGVDWRPTNNRRLGTFHIVAFSAGGGPGIEAEASA